MGAIFQASDLNRRSRAVLEAARAGEARVRDQDGLGLLLLPEARVRALRVLAAAAANLATLEGALTVGGPRRLADYGEWTWLRHLPVEDLAAFVADLREAVIVAAREEQVDALEAALYAWRASADALADPDSRAILLGDVGDDDFVEVGRPGDEASDLDGRAEAPDRP